MYERGCIQKCMKVGASNGKQRRGASSEFWNWDIKLVA